MRNAIILLLILIGTKGESLPNWDWYYYDGNADFAVMASPSMENHWYHVHCTPTSYLLGHREGARYRLHGDMFIPDDPSLIECRYTATRHEPVQFLPIINRPSGFPSEKGEN